MNRVESKLERVAITITDDAITITETSNHGHESSHLVTGDARTRSFAALGVLLREAHAIAESTVHRLPDAATAVP